MGQASIAPLYFIDVPGSEVRGNVDSLKKWLDEVLRPNYFDFRAWYPHGRHKALRDEAVRKRIEALGNSLSERIQPRLASSIPGNLRRLNPPLCRSL